MHRPYVEETAHSPSATMAARRLLWEPSSGGTNRESDESYTAHTPSSSPLPRTSTRSYLLGSRNPISQREDNNEERYMYVRSGGGGDTTSIIPIRGGRDNSGLREAEGRNINAVAPSSAPLPSSLAMGRSLFGTMRGTTVGIGRHEVSSLSDDVYERGRDSAPLPTASDKHTGTFTTSSNGGPTPSGETDQLSDEVDALLSKVRATMRSHNESVVRDSERSRLGAIEDRQEQYMHKKGSPERRSRSERALTTKASDDTTDRFLFSSSRNSAVPPQVSTSLEQDDGLDASSLTKRRSGKRLMSPPRPSSPLDVHVPPSSTSFTASGQGQAADGSVLGAYTHKEQLLSSPTRARGPSSSPHRHVTFRSGEYGGGRVSLSNTKADETIFSSDSASQREGRQGYGTRMSEAEADANDGDALWVGRSYAEDSQQRYSSKAATLKVRPSAELNAVYSGWRDGGAEINTNTNNNKKSQREIFLEAQLEAVTRELVTTKRSPSLSSPPLPSSPIRQLESRPNISNTNPNPAAGDKVQNNNENIISHVTSSRADSARDYAKEEVSATLQKSSEKRPLHLQEHHRRHQGSPTATPHEPPSNSAPAPAPASEREDAAASIRMLFEAESSIVSADRVDALKAEVKTLTEALEDAKASEQRARQYKDELLAELTETREEAAHLAKEAKASASLLQMYRKEYQRLADQIRLLMSVGVGDLLDLWAVDEGEGKGGELIHVSHSSYKGSGPMATHGNTVSMVSRSHVATPQHKKPKEQESQQKYFPYLLPFTELVSTSPQARRYASTSRKERHSFHIHSEKVFSGDGAIEDWVKDKVDTPRRKAVLGHSATKGQQPHAMYSRTAQVLSPSVSITYKSPAAATARATWGGKSNNDTTPAAGSRTPAADAYNASRGLTNAEGHQPAFFAIPAGTPRLDRRQFEEDGEYEGEVLSPSPISRSGGAGGYSTVAALSDDINATNEMSNKGLIGRRRHATRVLVSMLRDADLSEADDDDVRAVHSTAEGEEEEDTLVKVTRGLLKKTRHATCQSIIDHYQQYIVETKDHISIATRSILVAAEETFRGVFERVAHLEDRVAHLCSRRASDAKRIISLTKSNREMSAMLSDTIAQEAFLRQCRDAADILRKLLREGAEEIKARITETKLLHPHFIATVERTVEKAVRHTESFVLGSVTKDSSGMGGTSRIDYSQAKILGSGSSYNNNDNNIFSPTPQGTKYKNDTDYTSTGTEGANNASLPIKNLLYGSPLNPSMLTSSSPIRASSVGGGLFGEHSGVSHSVAALGSGGGGAYNDSAALLSQTVSQQLSQKMAESLAQQLKNLCTLLSNNYSQQQTIVDRYGSVVKDWEDRIVQRLADAVASKATAANNSAGDTSYPSFSDNVSERKHRGEVRGGGGKMGSSSAFMTSSFFHALSSPRGGHRADESTGSTSTDDRKHAQNNGVSGRLFKPSSSSASSSPSRQLSSPLRNKHDSDRNPYQARVGGLGVGLGEGGSDTRAPSPVRGEAWRARAQE